MNVLIFTDLEGVSGVDDITMLDRDDEGAYRRSCQCLMDDLAASAEGCLEAGADIVYAVDGHGGGGNFLPESMHPAVTVPSRPLETLFGEGRVQACLAVGYHAMAGTLNGFLDHTQDSRKWHNYWVNGVLSGEIRQIALFAGAYGIPLVMVSGDESACREAQDLITGIQTAPVKRGLGRNRAKLYPQKQSRDAIRAAAATGIERKGCIKPYSLPMPLELRLEFNRSDMCDDLCAQKPHMTRIDARTVRRETAAIELFTDLLF